MTSSHWRIAAGSCLFATVLMANSGVAVAFADTDAGSATTTANGTDTSAPATDKQTSPLANGALALRNGLHGVASALGLDHQFNGQGGSSTNSSKSAILDDSFAATARITRTVTGALDRRPAAVAPTDDPVTPQPVVAPYVAPATDPAPAFDLSTPAATVIAAAQNAVAPVATQIAAIPGLAAAPIADVLTSLQNVITATNVAVAPFVQLPTDFANLFPAATQPVSAPDSHTFSAPAVTVPAPVLTVRALSELGSADNTGGAQPVVTPLPANTSMLDTTTALAGGSAQATSAPVDPQAAVSEGLQQFFSAYGTLILAASLSALLGAALPGILGIVIPTIAGMRIGYRQAKAGSTLRATDIGRFAGVGPVGIVRSGTLVAFRPRAARVTRQPAELRSHQVA